jgi:uncharacterized protein
MTSNRLIHATSPYLLQHAHNPVDWFEWSEEALTKAIQEDKPILVSIGYSSCHWCHVMEHQSFEDNDIAALMNEFFVCIKVDREERPDIDQVYMEAVQAMNVNGGWPLNVFLTPDQKPFFGGTYFTPTAWSQILININKAFKSRRKEVDASAEELRNLLASSDTSRFIKSEKISPWKQEIEKSYQSIEKKFDYEWGGLEKAPKFIMPSVWQWLLRYHHVTKNTIALDHVTITLKKILYGGIYDQVGGGFARYSVDKEWFAPHFEKMLYDNAQLLSLYSEAYAVTKEEDFKRAVYETFDWLQREMMHADGAYFSALDADSEGEEGKFYVWKSAELLALLGDDYMETAAFFETEENGNWEHGNNILKRSATATLSEDKLQTVKKLLLDARNQRPKPGLDDKILAGWNAMTVQGLCDAYRYLGDERLLQSAHRAISFIENNLIYENTLYRSFKHKPSSHEGFLDDYAYLIAAYLHLHLVTLDDSFAVKAKRWIDITFEKFFDNNDGYFYYTATTAEKLIARKKELFDNVIPSSNAVMALNLLRASSLFDHEPWRETATTMIDRLAHLIREELNYTSYWGMAAMEMMNHAIEIEIVLSSCSEHAKKELQSHFIPAALFLKGDDGSALPLAHHKKSVNGKETFYVCFNKTCKLPVHTVNDALQEILKASEIQSY